MHRACPCWLSDSAATPPTIWVSQVSRYLASVKKPGIRASSKKTDPRCDGVSPLLLERRDQASDTFSGAASAALRPYPSGVKSVVTLASAAHPIPQEQPDQYEDRDHSKCCRAPIGQDVRHVFPS